MDDSVEFFNQLYSFSKQILAKDFLREDKNQFIDLISMIKKMYDFDFGTFLEFDKFRNSFYFKEKGIEYENYYIRMSFENKVIIMKSFNEKSGLKGLSILYPTTIIVVPIFFENDFYGVLYFESNKFKNFSSNDFAVMSIFGTQISSIYKNYKLAEQLKQNFLATIRTLVAAIELKDHYTRGHSQRVTLYAQTFAEYLGLDRSMIESIRWAALLHDIGKIGIHENILNKKGILTNEERAEIEKHPVKGEELLKPLEFLKYESKIIRHHHERWDGNGYPDKIEKDNIPLESRIITLADSYDAMSSTRPYSPPLDIKQIKYEIEKNKGSQFDPYLAKKFLEMLNKNLIAY